MLTGLLKWFILLTTLFGDSFSQTSWVPPFQIDSAATDPQYNPLVAISPTGRVAVALLEGVGGNPQFGRIAVYRSDDNAGSFEKATLPLPPVSKYTVKRPEALSFDTDGNLYVLWAWAEVLPSHLVVSKSTDGGITFSEFWTKIDTESQLRQRRMVISNDNTVHVLWDSSAGPQQTIIAFYTRFIAGDPGNRIDRILPSPGKSLNVPEANFLVSEDTVDYVCMAAPFQIYDFSVYYARSTNAGVTFSDLVPVDTMGADYPVIAKSNYGASFVFFSRGDQRTFSLLYGRQIIDSTLTLGPQFRIGPSWMVTQPEPSFAGNQFGNFLTYEATDTIVVSTAYYEYDDLQAGPIDSSSFPLLRDPQLAFDSQGGKYLVASHQTNFRVYVTNKDVVLGVSHPLPLENEFQLQQNYPNPFNPSTKIRFSTPGLSRVSLRVYDVIGREVETLLDNTLVLGAYDLTWAPRGLSSGIFYLRLVVEDSFGFARSQTKAALYLK